MPWLDLAGAAIVSFLVCAGATPGVIWVARRVGMVATPRADRWNRQTVALLGGVGIVAGFFSGVLVFGAWESGLLSLLIGAAFMFGVGLWDDIRPLSPQNKLIGQIIAACIPVLGGVVFKLPLYAPLTGLVTVLWIVSITNALNLMDNMDGLAAGTAVITAGFLVGFANQHALAETALVAAAVAGAAFGFLLYNFHPARIFMGDSGSLVLGYVLAAATALGDVQPKVGVIWTLLAPVALLGMPIFDTVFVSLQRLIHGRRISQGGTDHTSHRLVALGLSERSAVLLIYAVSALLGSLALLTTQLFGFAGLVLAAVSLGLLVSFGRLLAHVEVYPPTQRESVAGRLRSGGAVVLPAIYFNRKRVMEVLQDTVLIGGAFGAALTLQAESFLLSEALRSSTALALSIVVGVKIAALFLFGVYRGVWRYASSHDLWRIIGALLAAQAVLAFVLPPYLPGRNAIAFLILDWILAMNLLAGARFLLKAAADVLGARHLQGRRVLIVGADLTGTSILREIRSNPTLRLIPVAFLDNDEEKQGAVIGGLPVAGRRSELEAVASSLAIDEVILPATMPRTEIAQLIHEMDALGVRSRIYQTSLLERSG